MKVKYTNVLLVIIAVLEPIFKGFVTATLWEWFATPLGLPSISVAHMIGLLTLMGAVGLSSPDIRDESRDIRDESRLQLVLRAFTGPVLALIVGWVAHYFI